MNRVKTKYHTFEEYEKAEYTKGVEGHSATQLIRMYRVAREVEEPVILELGVANGASTTVFLQACEEADGKLVSVDIKDCSGISDSSRWTFVQSNSSDIENVLGRAPNLNASKIRLF